MSKKKKTMATKRFLWVVLAGIIGILLGVRCSGPANEQARNLVVNDSLSVEICDKNVINKSVSDLYDKKQEIIGDTLFSSAQVTIMLDYKDSTVVETYRVGSRTNIKTGQSRQDKVQKLEHTVQSAQN